MNYMKSTSLEYFRDLLFVLTQKEIKVRYKSSWLGYAWSVAHPLAFAILYFVAFGIFMRIPIQNYPLFLISGLFPWQWVANSVNTSPRIFLANSTLLKKVRFPRNVLVSTTVLNDGIHFLISIPIILAFVVFYGFFPSPTWLLGIPLLTVAQFLIVYGFAIAIATLNVFFRDLERLTVLLITFLFFLTPIVYSASMVPIDYLRWLYINPVAPLILSWQDLFLTGTLNWPAIATAYGHGFIVLLAGSIVYSRLCWKLAEAV